MGKKFWKRFGDNPEDVTVLNQTVSFDTDGVAEVDDEVAEVLEQIPGYDFVSDSSSSEGEDPQVGKGKKAIDEGDANDPDPDELMKQLEANSEGEATTDTNEVEDGETPDKDDNSNEDTDTKEDASEEGEEDTDTNEGDSEEGEEDADKEAPKKPARRAPARPKR